MKILFLYYSPWWNATAYYGVTLAYGLQKAGHTVWFGTDPAVPSAQRAQEHGVPLFPCNLQSGNPFRIMKESQRCAEFLKNEHMDIVYTLSPQGHFLHFLAVRLFSVRDGSPSTRGGNVKIPLVRACCDVRAPKNHFFNRYLYKKCVDWLIFPCKKNLDRYYPVLQFSPKKTSVIYAGIDLARFDANRPEPFVRTQFGIPANAPIVGNAARLSPEKGHRHFLNVAARVLEKINNVHFVIVGKEEQISIPSLREEARKLGIENNVHFTGYLTDPRRAMQEFTIGVIASRFSETISRAALEFMALSKPVFATNVNVLGELIQHRKTGMVFAIDDVQGMADGIIEVLTDKSKCTEWGENARADIEQNFTLEQFTRKTEAIFKDIITDTY